MISKEVLNNMADLAKLSLSPEELNLFQKEISGVLAFVDKIKELDTEGVELTEQLEMVNHPLREDVVGASLSHEDVMKNTVEEQYGYFKILNIMD